MRCRTSMSMVCIEYRLDYKEAVNLLFLVRIIPQVEVEPTTTIKLTASHSSGKYNLGSSLSYVRTMKCNYLDNSWINVKRYKNNH